MLVLLVSLFTVKLYAQINIFKTNIVIDISSSVPYLAKFWFSSMGQKNVGQSSCSIL